MPASITVVKTSKCLFSAPYTHTGVKSLVQYLMDSQGIGQFELSKRAGLSPAAVFQILNKTEKDVTRPPRRSTLGSLAQSIGARVSFVTKDKSVHFGVCQDYEMPKTERREISLLLSQIGSLVLSSGRRISAEDRQRIVKVVRVLIE